MKNFTELLHEAVIYLQEKASNVYIQHGLEIISSYKEKATEYYTEELKNDWQLQGCIILLIILVILTILIKIKWNKYGSIIMEIGPNNADTVDGTFENFPDEDPLTFTKKTQ